MLPASGTEEFCHGVLDHDGKPKRKYNEVKEVIDSLSVFGDDWIASKYQADVAVYYDVENAWAWGIQPQSNAFEYKREFLRFYRPAHRMNAKTDIVTKDSNLDGYKVLIVPVYFLTDPAVNEKISRFAEQGGTVILSYRAGVKEQNNFVVEDTLPGALRELAGVEINEYESLELGQSNAVEGVEGVIKGLSSVASIWCDLVEPKTAEVLAEYRSCFYEKTAAITKNQYGKGTVYYIGSALEEEMMDALYSEVFKDNDVNMMDSSEKVEAVTRTGLNGSIFLCVVNHSTEENGSLTLPEGTWVDAVSHDKFSGEMAVAPLASYVLKT